LLTDNVHGLNEAVHMVTTRFQHFDNNWVVSY